MYWLDHKKKTLQYSLILLQLITLSSEKALSQIWLPYHLFLWFLKEQLKFLVPKESTLIYVNTADISVMRYGKSIYNDNIALEHNTKTFLQTQTQLTNDLN